MEHASTPTGADEVQLDAGDYALLFAGGTAAAGLWAAIGVGLGALVRDQVPTLIGICAWLLLSKGCWSATSRTSPTSADFAPGAAAQAISRAGP